MLSWINLAIVAGAVTCVTVGLYLMERWFPRHRRAKHNEVAGYIFAAIGVLYAVLMAFVIVVLWGDNDTAQQTTYREANDLGAVYWLSRHIPLAQGRPLERITLAYARTVETREWPLMERHQSSPAATRLVYQMRDAAFSMNPATLRDQVLFQEVTTSVTALAADRRIRLDAVGEGVPSFMRGALVGGSVLTVAFTFLFGTSSTRVHIVMAGLFAAAVAITLILINDLNYPFAGPGRISPEAFQVFLSRLPPPRLRRPGAATRGVSAG